MERGSPLWHPHDGFRGLEPVERRHNAPDTASRAKTRPPTTRRKPRRAGLMGMRRVRWPVLLLTRLVLPLALLVLIAGSIVYVRLLNGAVSLKPIAAPIARALAAELPGFDVSIEDASVLMAEGRGLEFRLRNIKLLDQRGATVAHAPDAAVTLSTPALWSGRIAPARIILIEPSLLLQHTRERGLSLSFEQAGQSVAAGSASGQGAGQLSSGQGDVGGALGAMLAKSGQALGAASYIKGIGLRNATLAIDSAGQRGVVRVREADIGVDRRRDSSLLGTSLVVDSARGPWQLTMVASRSEASNSISIDMRVTDLVPSALASAWPLMGPLSVLDMPVRGTATIKLSATNDIAGAHAELDLGRGAIAPGWRGDGRMPIDGGRVSLRYDPEARRLALATSRIASGPSWAAFAGGITFGAEAGMPWQVELAATEGQVAAPEFGQGPRPLEAFRVRGRFDPAAVAFDLAEAQLKAGGGEITMSGHVPSKGAATRLQLHGRMSPMGVDAMKLMWPSIVAPAARQWSGKQVQQGRLTSGTFIVEDVGHGADRGRAGADGLRIGVSIEGSGVRIQPKPGFSPVEAQRVLVRLEANALEVAAPEAVIITAPQRRLPIRGVRLVSSDVAAPAAIGDLTFRAQGALPAALDLAEQQAARNGRGLTLPGEALDGRIEA